MKNYIFYSIIVIAVLFITTGCSFKINNINKSSKNEIINKIDEEIDSMKVIIDNKEYKLNLEDNDTTKSFIKLLPKTWKMNELNGNEKYVYLSSPLPVKPINPKKIEKGDVMIFGDNCLVIFYQSFKTNYSYTKIGNIENLPDLGNSSIEVEFTKD